MLSELPVYFRALLERLPQCLTAWPAPIGFTCFLLILPSLYVSLGAPLVSLLCECFCSGAFSVLLNLTAPPLGPNLHVGRQNIFNSIFVYL